MKYLSGLLVAVSLLSACKKDPQETAMDKSYKRWQKFKNKTNDRYRYLVTQSSWIGRFDTTVITVEKGSVAARDYRVYTFDPQTSRNVLRNSWSETGSALNSHQEGAAVSTLDEVYAKAKAEWLKVDSKTNTIYFETNNNGMISVCGYVPDNCMDDCFIGINISEISAVKDIR